MEFEDSEENKFVYTDIHKEYVSQKKLVLCCEFRECNKSVMFAARFVLFSGRRGGKIHREPVDAEDA